MMNEEEFVPDENIRDELARLERTIQSGQFVHELENVQEWTGADVIITSKPEIGDLPQKYVVGFQGGNPGMFIAGDFRIVTEHAKSLSWLFCQLRDAFASRIDYANKYDFYGRLAHRAAGYLDGKMDGTTTAKGLLSSVLDEARTFLK